MIEINFDELETFGTKLKVLRCYRGYSMTALAKLLEMTQPALYFHEANNTKIPSGKFLKPVCELLEVSPNHFYGSESLGVLVFSDEALNSMDWQNREALLKIADNNKGYDTTLKNIEKSTDLEITISGMNNSGKTTLMKHIVDFLNAKGCQVAYAETPYDTHYKDGRNGVGFTPDKNFLKGKRVRVKTQKAKAKSFRVPEETHSTGD